MAIRTRIESIEKDISIIVNEMLTPAAQSRAVAEFARGRLIDAQDTNRQILGRVPPHTTSVDGRMGAALESVRPHGGVIIFEFEIIADVPIWIGKMLQERSPFVSGDYRRGHTLFADGVETQIGTTVPPAQEYSFTNLVPYARKIEIGRTNSGRAFVLQVPNRIYEWTARDARARFGNVAKITFSYRGIVGGAMMRGRAGNKSNVRFPTIIVTPN